jgi:hypothetical protein
VKVSLNLRGPSRKAKYSLATDSEPSSASERWEEPLQGEDSEPETTCLQAIRARLLSSPLSVLVRKFEKLTTDNCKLAIEN